nr:MAG TPA: hypothetical protein [Caudoviricetes sp.]
MDPNRKPTIWQYARRKFVDCQCLYRKEDE